MRFSVVIPCYNASSTIERALASVLGQTFSDYEILVVDDGSSDDTVARVRSVAAKAGPAAERIRLLRQENRGAAAARNLAMGQARGEAIAFLDADDFWEPEYLTEVNRALQLFPQGGAVCSNFYVLYPERSEPALQAARGEHGRKEHRWGEPVLVADYFTARATDHLVISTSGVTVRRSGIERAGLMRDDLRRSQDTEYWARLAACGIQWVFHPRPLHWVDQTSTGSLSRTRTGPWHTSIPLPEEWSREIWPLLVPDMLPSFTTLYLWRTRYLCAMFLEAGRGDMAKRAAREALPRAASRPGQRLGLFLLALLPPRLSWALWRLLRATRQTVKRMRRLEATPFAPATTLLRRP